MFEIKASSPTLFNAVIVDLYLDVKTLGKYDPTKARIAFEFGHGRIIFGHGRIMSELRFFKVVGFYYFPVISFARALDM